MVVIALIGLLATIVYVSLKSSQAKSRDARRATDAIQISQALGMYHNDHEEYPCYIDADPCPTGGATSTEAVIDGTDNLSVKLRSAGLISGVPADPLHNGAYEYWYSSDGTDYTIRFCQERDSIQRLSQGCNNFIRP